MKLSVTSQPDPRKGLTGLVTQLNKVKYFGLDDIVDKREQAEVTVSFGAATHNTTNLIAVTQFGPFCFCNLVATGNVTINVLSFQVALPVRPKLRRGPANFQTLPVSLDFAVVAGVISPNPAHGIISIPQGSEVGRLTVSAPNYGFWGFGAYAFAGSFVYPVEPTV